MTKRTALWILVGLWATAMIPGLGGYALAQPGDDVGVPADDTTGNTTAQDNGEEALEEEATDDERVDDSKTPTTQPADTDTAQEPTPFLQRWFLPLLLVGFALLWYFGSRKSRQAEKRRQAMLSNLKKGDKVTSIGGIIGTVVDVRDNEIVVKVDDAANTRMRFVRKAISHVGPPDQAEDERK